MEKKNQLESLSKGLLDNAKALNQALETSYLSLALVLVEIHETEAWKDAGHEDFPTYYREELGREKSTVSRLLEVGRWLKQVALEQPPTGIGYKKLYQAIKAFPEKDPEYILAAASVNSLSELQKESREKVQHECDAISVCKTCWRRM